MGEYSNPVEVFRKAKRYLGKNVNIKVSTRKNKKYMVYNPKTNKWVHFGSLGYQDYTKHKNKTRRQSYLKRATHIKGDWKNDKYSPNNLAIHILW